MIATTETLLKRTTSRCPVCHTAAPAEVWRRSEGGKQTVWLRRRCAEHGAAEACISSDARFYWLAQGDPRNGCASCSGDGGHDGTLGVNAAADTSEQEKLSTCLALIEIVTSCNLACPTCYADSPQSTRIDAVPLADLQQRIDAVIARKGRIEILQLSGGEPTLHPELIAGVCSLNGTANMVEYAKFQNAIIASYGGTKTQVPDEYEKRSAELWPERFTMPVARMNQPRPASIKATQAAEPRAIWPKRSQ